MSAFRIHRYILREVAVPMGLGLLIFTFVLLMGRTLRLVEMVINKGVPFLEIAKIFLYLLPSFLVLTLPLAFLLGILLAFSRFSADSEIVALKSSGISLYGLMKPVILLALPTCLATAGMTFYAQPAGKSAFRSQIFQIAKSRASVGFQARVFNDEFDGLVLYANQVDERRSSMEGILISDERMGTTPSLVQARHGRVIEDRDALTLTLRLEDGTIHRRPRQKEADAYQVINFSTYDINLNMGQELDDPGTRRKESDLTLAELRKAIADSPADGRVKVLRAELHKRFVLPFAPLPFALLGVPLGVRSHRSGRGGGFALGLILFLLYYMAFSFAGTLAVEGGMPAPVVLWLPNLLFLGAGIHLLYLAAAEKRIPFSGHLQDWAARLTRRGKKE